MATNLPRESTTQISGMQDEFKRTVLKRGTTSITLSSATTNSAGLEGTATVDVTDIYSSSLGGLTFPPFGFPKVEVSLVTVATASNAIGVTPLPFTQFTTSNSVNNCGSFDLTSYVNVVPTERIYVNLNIYLRLSNTLLASLLSYTLYYTIYSEVSQSTNWDYKS